MPTSATTDGSERVSSTVAESPGPPGAIGTSLARSKCSSHAPHDVACSHRPWMNTTGILVSDMGTSGVVGTGSIIAPRVTGGFSQPTARSGGGCGPVLTPKQARPHRGEGAYADE